MRFHLLDNLESVTDDRITAVKAVSQSEEYLADHFPSFPVLPGVMMLEAATQAAAWIVFGKAGLLSPGVALDDYQGPTLAVLKAARNVRYGHFVAPGRSLRVVAEYQKPTDTGHAFRIEGSVETETGPKTAITGKIELACFRVSDLNPALAAKDRRLAEAHLVRWTNLNLARSAAVTLAGTS